MLVALLTGFVLSFLGSMPIAGPVAAMVLDRALGGRGREARAIAVGASIAEAGYALMAFGGLTTMLAAFPRLLPGARAVGAVLFIAIGLYLALRGPRRPGDGRPSREGAGWLFGFSVTAVNPTLLVTWTTVVTAVHSTGWLPSAPLDALPFALGVGAGAVTWFVVLVALVARYRGRMKQAWVEWAVRATGVVFVVAGVVVAIRLARG